MLLSFRSSLKGLHSCLRLGYRSMTLLFAHNPSSRLPTQPLLVSINKPPRLINKSPNDVGQTGI